jgi:hypothetical protein
VAQQEILQIATAFPRNRMHHDHGCSQILILTPTPLAKTAKKLHVPINKVALAAKARFGLGWRFNMTYTTGLRMKGAGPHDLRNVPYQSWLYILSARLRDKKWRSS